MESILQQVENADRARRATAGKRLFETLRRAALGEPPLDGDADVVTECLATLGWSRDVLPGCIASLARLEAGRTAHARLPELHATAQELRRASGQAEREFAQRVAALRQEEIESAHANQGAYGRAMSAAHAASELASRGDTEEQRWASVLDGTPVPASQFTASDRR